MPTKQEQDGREGQYFFADFRLDVADERLFRGDRVVPLKPKPFRLLLRLLQARGSLVSKRDLLNDVWSDVKVTESVLKVCVGEIRAVLGDDPDAPRYIETVHGRGYRFIAPRSEPPAELAPVPALIGRTSELETLRDAFERVTCGASRMLLIEGDPGIGKTTLVERFLASIEAAQSAYVAHGRCVLHRGHREPYMPVLEGIARICRSAEGKSFLDVLVRHAPAWAVHWQGMLEPEALSHAKTRALGATFGRRLREMGDFFEAVARDKPVVLCVDDLQWSDRATLELLEYLARRRTNTRLLMLATLRSHAAAECEAPPLLSFCGAAGWQELLLRPLSTREVEQLLEERFGTAGWVPDVASRLHERTGGNPLFLQTLLNQWVRVRSAYREGHEWLFRETEQTWRVPRDFRVFILQRVQATSESEQRVLHAASVVGREFDTAVLANVLDLSAVEVLSTCEALIASGFLERAADESAPAPIERFRFVHPVYPQVLYDSLSSLARIEYHRSTAQYLRTTRASAARLAHHYEQAKAFAEAVEYHTAAGEFAYRQYAYHEAIAHLERALDLLQHVPEFPQRSAAELRALLALGQPLINVHGWAAPVVERTYLRVHVLCDELGGAARFSALAGLYKYFVARGQFDRASGIAAESLTIAEEIGYRPLCMTGHSIVGIVRYFEGNLPGAIEELSAGRSLYDFEECRSFAQLFGDDPGVGCIAFLGRATWLAGDHAAGLAFGYEALELARRLAHPHVISTALTLVALLEVWQDDARAVANLANELLVLAQNQSFALWSILGRFLSAWARARDGDSGALTELEQALVEYDAHGSIADRSMYATLIAELHLRFGRLHACLKFARAALDTPPRMPIWDLRLSEICAICESRLAAAE